MEFGVFFRFIGDFIYEFYVRRVVKRFWEYRFNIIGLLGKIGFKVVFFIVELFFRVLFKNILYMKYVL